MGHNFFMGFTLKSYFGRNSLVSFKTIFELHHCNILAQTYTSVAHQETCTLLIGLCIIPDSLSNVKVTRKFKISK